MWVCVVWVCGVCVWCGCVVWVCVGGWCGWCGVRCDVCVCGCQLGQASLSSLKLASQSDRKPKTSGRRPPKKNTFSPRIVGGRPPFAVAATNARAHSHTAAGHTAVGGAHATDTAAPAAMNWTGGLRCVGRWRPTSGVWQPAVAVVVFDLWLRALPCGHACALFATPTHTPTHPHTRLWC